MDDQQPVRKSVFQYRDDLFRALRKNDFEEIKKCLQAGEDPSARDEWGHTLLHEAIKDGDSRLFDYLINNTSIDVNAKSYYFGNTPLLIATQCGRLDYMQQLLAKGANINDVDRNGFTCLHYALNRSDIRIVKFLIKTGADLNIINAFSDTPLSLALGKHDITTIKLLLLNGADLKLKRPMSIPLFHEAVLQYKSRDLNILHLLYSYGADPHEADDCKRTPMHYAALVGYVAVATFLVQLEADINVLDVSGRTPLDVATIHQNDLMVDFLNCKKAKHGKNYFTSSGCQFFVRSEH